MVLPETELIRILGALFALLLTSHVLGGVFQRLHQPRVIGEITGGMLWGPALLGSYIPQIHQALFAANEGHQQILGFVFWLGLLLLLFCSGLETPIASRMGEWKTTLWLTALGTIVPLAIGLVASRTLDLHRFWGSQAHETSFGLLLAMTVAVTAIPVISKILFELDLMGTAFAQVVLTVAMIEDMVLWVLLSFTMGMEHGDGPGALALGLLVTIAFFTFCQLFGHRIFDHVSRWGRPFFGDSPNGIPIFLVFLLVVLMAHLLGVNPIFGAFLAGRIVANTRSIPEERKKQITGFSFAFFVPLYFASVGLKITFQQGFHLPDFFLVLGCFCLIKLTAVYLGAVFSGQKPRQSLHLAMALNGRGGMGVVLASVALDANLINNAFYAILVLVSLFTSQLSGWWLYRVKHRAPQELDLQFSRRSSRLEALPHIAVPDGSRSEKQA